MSNPEQGEANKDEILEVNLTDIDLGSNNGIGLSEASFTEELAMEDMERRELLVNPSDLQDVGDPETGDVGVAGGLAAGGEMGEGGYGVRDNDPWGLELLVETKGADETLEEGLV